MIPAERSKNGKAHSVPLSPLAIALFKEAKATAGDSKYLFPSPRNPDVPISRDTVTRALQVNRERLGLEDVRVHDLRRTASSNMSALGVPKHVRERVLNHSLGRLDQSYDLYEYLAEKRAALIRWSERLQVIVRTDEKVVPLDTASA